MALFITFNSIIVNILDTNTSISIGNNSQSSWDSHSKNAFGSELLGNFLSVGTSNFISNNDIIDTPIFDQDIKPGVQVQTC